MCTIAGSDDGTPERTSAPSSSTQEQPWGERQRRGSDASDRDSGTVARFRHLFGGVLGFNRGFLLSAYAKEPTRWPMA